MMKQLIYSSIIFIFICSSLYSQTGITKQDYLEAIKKAEATDWQGYKESIKKWKQKLEINVSASWGRWSIEDAQIYIPAWIKPMMEYAELMGVEEEYYTNSMTKYYFDYLVQLMTPGGQIVEFGDGRFGRGYT